MSFDVGVHLWFDEPAEDRWPGLFGACLDASLAPVAPNLRLPLDTPVKLSVCERSDNNLLWYRTAAAGECAPVVTHLHSFKGPYYIFHAELAFPCVLYSPNDHRLERTIHPLDLRLSGPDPDAQGYEFKRKGLISFSFSNVKVFGMAGPLNEYSLLSSLADAERFKESIKTDPRNPNIVPDHSRGIVVEVWGRP